MFVEPETVLGLNIGMKDRATDGYFVLLPVDTSHDEKLFHQTPDGPLIDETHKVCKVLRCEDKRQEILWRMDYVSEIFWHFSKHRRIVTVYGDSRGIGCSQIALMACRYLFERPYFTAIVQVKLRSIVNVTTTTSSGPVITTTSRSTSTSDSSTNTENNELASEETVLKEAMYRIWSTLASSFPLCIDTSARKPSRDNITMRELIELIQRITIHLTPKSASRVMHNSSLSASSAISSSFASAPAITSETPKILLFLDDCNAYMTPPVIPSAEQLQKSIPRTGSDSYLNGNQFAYTGQPPRAHGIHSAKETTESSIPPPVPLNRTASADFTRTTNFPSPGPEHKGDFNQSFPAAGRYSFDSAASYSVPPSTSSATTTIHQLATSISSNKLQSEGVSDAMHTQTSTTPRRFQSSNPINTIVYNLNTELPNVFILLTSTNGHQLIPPDNMLQASSQEFIVRVKEMDTSSAVKMIRQG